VLDDLVIARFNDAAQICRNLSNADSRDLAAVLVDPIMSNAGVVASTNEFLNALRDACSRHGVVLIFDEVIAGFRIARGGVSELCGVAPDRRSLENRRPAG
jgi:glutamate-1-semialdehyde 2,1-aminomutase